MGFQGVYISWTCFPDETVEENMAVQMGNNKIALESSVNKSASNQGLIRGLEEYDKQTNLEYFASMSDIS